MRSTPLIINWHDKNTPIYSAHFEPQHGKGRLATGGGDNNVRIWKVEADDDTRRVDYLSTLAKHTQAVNVVRWAPKGETLASAGDDGNVILWVPNETHNPTTFGNEGLEDKETWRAKHMFRPTAAEIYDLAWSPDATHFIIGSMDNVARIYNAGSGALIRQIAEHSHYVQGVAWDPLNEYIATQSSDRSVHIYSLKTKNGQYALTGRDDETFKVASHIKADLPPRRISSNSPAPPDMGYRSQLAAAIDTPSASIGSPVPSAPGTPQSVPLPMNPPSVVSHSRRSSFSSRRSVSPAPSLPLPAVMPIEPSPKLNHGFGLGVKNASLYANETLTSFFRRLTFTPDGSLLLTPAGQYHVQHQDGPKPSYEIINTVYIYTRGGINKPPIAHLPGHKKPSVAIKCSPIMYTLRQSPPVTKYITIDTSSAEDPIPALPEPISKPSSAVMDPPPPPTSSAPDPEKSWTPQHLNVETGSATPGSKMGFTLPYRMVYAVATQDSVLLYDTQQVTPICVVSNLHLATFTDLTWSSDGATLLITSSDGFCSTLSFLPGELGQEYKGELVGPKVTSAPITAPSTQATPQPTPTSIFAPPSPFPNHQHRNSATSFAAPSPPPTTSFVSARPSSPARSNSTSSIATQVSVMNNPPLIGGNLPSITAASSGKVTGVPMTTPPETPGSTNTVVGVKREASTSEKDEDSGGQSKKRRIAPTLVTDPKA
ncbi:WD40 repeat-like protein [Annulohypoxylon maeteangense]|uniref:WD40 repeat-like protein n=1 Tax=Annulohypoxylon maeteangense TaxID=1927788 RepID=UPI002007B726|nr:WD40 repeat-like protein [Annulohypoxylon maeteangense]KAI0881493.1 WD40 repeat-like protein [Annulohypoxylon maeteangense]